MNTPLDKIKPFTYTTPDGLKLKVLFTLDPEKKGYINATAIAKHFGREPKDWLKNNNVQAYINSLIKRTNSRSENSPNGTISITYNDLVITIQGRTPEQQGTWLHPKLGVIFARWLTPDFAVWCDENITWILNQHPEYQQQFPELSAIFNKLEEFQQQNRWENNQRFYALEQNVYALGQNVYALGQDMQALHQRFDTTEKALNHFHTKFLQETKHTVGQIHNGIRQLDQAVKTQAQMELLQPSTQEAMQKLLVEYQHILQTFLQNQQEELITSYLLKIKEQTAQVLQRLPILPKTTPTQTQQEESLADKIANLRTEGKSWSAIAQMFNIDSIPTASGKGKWHGSSVKKYWERNG